LGTFVRDKDSISSSCLLAEAAAAAKQEKRTLLDQLHQIYNQFGVHREMLKNINFNDSQEGMDRMQSMMRKLRENPPSKIGGQAVAKVEDYLRGNSNLPPSDVLRYWLDDGSKLVIRPSGTEPKVKIYAETVGQAISSCDEHLKNLVCAFEQLIL
jgi:phosphomannomutase